MTANPLISLIIPAYNAEPYLPECLASASGQTYANLEIIVIDDGSSDGTALIAEAAARNDPRIIVIRQNNTGVMLARKRAIETARGEYLCFLDSDDYLAKDAVETLFQAMQQMDADIICAGHNVVGSGSSTRKNECWQGVINGDTLMRYQLTNRMEGYLCTKLYRRNLFDNLHYPDLPVAEDKYLNIQIAAKNPVAGSIDQQVYFYVTRPESLSHRKTSIEHGIMLTKYVEQFLRNSECYEKYHKELAIMRLQNYWWHINRTSNPSIARLPFVAALHSQLADPEIQKLAAAYFSAGQRAVIRFHGHPATVWLGKTLTTLLRIRHSITKRIRRA